MTANEMKFALQVEMALNKIPQPEFRQLTVEAMAALITMVNEDITKNRWPEVIHVDHLVYKANDIFISEQVGVLIEAYVMGLNIMGLLQYQISSQQQRLPQAQYHLTVQKRALKHHSFHFIITTEFLYMSYFSILFSPSE